MTQNELALYLGISGAMVSKHKRMGMPTHSVFAARTWRAEHLDSSLVKELRRPELITTRPQRDPIIECNELGALAFEDLDRGASADFVAHVEQLRAVMRTLSKRQEDGVLLPFDVWDALCAFPGRWSDLFGVEGLTERLTRERQTA